MTTVADQVALKKELIASNIAFTPSGTISATNVQAAIVEVAAEAGGGGGGGASAASVVVDFGASRETSAAVVVTGLAWVTATMVLIARPFGTTAQHTEEDALIEQITAVCSAAVAGVGFTIRAHSPHGSVGAYRFAVVGIEV